MDKTSDNLLPELSDALKEESIDGSPDISLKEIRTNSWLLCTKNSDTVSIGSNPESFLSLKESLRISCDENIPSNSSSPCSPKSNSSKSPSLKSPTKSPTSKSNSLKRVFHNLKQNSKLKIGHSKPISPPKLISPRQALNSLKKKLKIGHTERRDTHGHERSYVEEDSIDESEETEDDEEDEREEISIIDSHGIQGLDVWCKTQIGQGKFGKIYRVSNNYSIG